MISLWYCYLLGWASAEHSVSVVRGTSVGDLLHCRLLFYGRGASPIGMVATQRTVKTNK